MLRCLRDGRWSLAHVLHFDPFAFVMTDEDAPRRATYAELLSAIDARVHAAELAAASLFFTWGRDNAKALADLDGAGYRRGLHGGHRDLVSRVRPSQGIAVRWCW